MTEFLVRKFVRDYERTEEADVRAAYGVLSSAAGILCNVFLFFLKLAVGLLMNSLAVIADAFNNLSDGASSVISLMSVKIAGKPADERHPFGHGRVEYIAALIVSFLVIEVGITLLKSSAGKLRNPEDISFELVPFLFLFLSVGVKLWMTFFNRKLGKRINSQVILAASADSLGDVVTTSATLFSILFSHFTGINIDAAAGLVVSLIVIWAGIGIAKDTIEPLIGLPADPEIARQIREAVEEYDGILGTHDLIIHNYGPNRSMASIHAEVPRDADIETSHEIIDRIEREVSKSLGIFLVIHMDPIEINDERVLAVREKVEQILQELDPEVTFHDFRVVWGEQQINLVFDVMVPYSYDEAVQETFRQRVCRRMEQEDPRYRCVITIDRSFTAQ